MEIAHKNRFIVVQRKMSFIDGFLISELKSVFFFSRPY